MASRSAAETSAHFITVDDVTSPEQLLRSKERLVSAFLLHNGRSNEEISELFGIYCDETRAMCAALEELLGAAPFMVAHEPSISNSAASAHKLLGQVEATLRSLHSSSGEKLRRINILKNFSLVFFTAAAATSAGMAALNAARREEAAATPAAGAALVFGALGGWFHSRLEKREAAEEKRREIAGVMISGAKIAIDDLAKIHSCTSEVESLSKITNEEAIIQVRKKMAALKMKLQELQSDYAGDTRYFRELVLDGMIKHFNYGN